MSKATLRRAAQCMALCAAVWPLAGPPHGPARAAARPVPAAMQPSAPCHAAVVNKYLEPGMSRSLGPAGGITAGAVKG